MAGWLVDHGSGVERIVQAFESGWKAGASLGQVDLDQFAAAEEGIRAFWLDGFYAAQASIGDDGLSSDVEDDADLMLRKAIRSRREGQQLSHPIARSLRAAYAEGPAPSHENFVTALSRLG